MQWILLYIYVLQCVLCIKACQKQITDNLINLLRHTYVILRTKNTISKTVNLSLRKKQNKTILNVLKKPYSGQKQLTSTRLTV